MEMMNIKAMAELLKPPDENSDSEDDMPKTSASKMGPADVGPKKPDSKPSKSIYAKKATKTDSKDIWEVEEVADGPAVQDLYDPRSQPEYEIVYKQAVSSEDMYLQMGSKNPSTASCEDMVVKIQLPDAKMADVKLDCKDTYLDCRSPKYKLCLPLPHPADSKNGTAKWDPETSILSVTLRMKREYDFMNF